MVKEVWPWCNVSNLKKYSDEEKYWAYYWMVSDITHYTNFRQPLPFLGWLALQESLEQHPLPDASLSLGLLAILTKT